jgi:hypothetical protein
VLLTPLAKSPDRQFRPCTSQIFCTAIAGAARAMVITAAR